MEHLLDCYAHTGGELCICDRLKSCEARLLGEVSDSVKNAFERGWRQGMSEAVELAKEARIPQPRNDQDSTYNSGVTKAWRAIDKVLWREGRRGDAR